MSSRSAEIRVPGRQSVNIYLIECVVRRMEVGFPDEQPTNSDMHILENIRVLCTNDMQVIIINAYHHTEDLFIKNVSKARHPKTCHFSEFLTAQMTSTYSSKSTSNML